MVARRLLTLPLMLIALAAAAACGSSTPPAPPTPTTAPTSPSIGDATVGGGEPTPVSFPPTAGEYASSALTAWRAHDAVSLRNLNADGDAIFATLDGGDYNRNFTLYRCTGAAGSSTCVFYNEVGDEVDLRLQNALLGHAHAIVDGQWHPITFPADYRAYAQEAITAWTGHNTAAVALLTGKTGDSAFASVPAARRGDAWTFNHDEGATGHLFYIFGNGAGDSIIVSFPSPGVAPVPANRHGLIEIIYYEAHV